MITIKLHNLIFFSFHGVHEEEKILGNNYEVNAELSFDSAGQIISLEETINYATVYKIIKQRMLIPTALLETLAQELSQLIYNADNRIKTISVTIEKKNPPIPNIQGTVSVMYTKDY